MLYSTVFAKRRFQGWLRVHVIGPGGFYVAMLTALLVVNWSALFDEPGRHSLWPWIIPTLGSTTLIAWAARRVTRTEWRAGA
ncbi:MAG TPA: hypothetical protein VFT23_06305 [Burkholderiales bacterium]|nr:hypothetical protein [Burkholderiales bacterium]